MTTKPTYRPDIEGLRALAVLAVLFYHFDIWPVTGGFVGVDVFFVVSGYLITKIILTEAQSATFSFSNFYNRRIRRLLPALLCTVAGSYLAGVILFSVEDFARVSGSAVAALLGISNIFFWREAGYFDANAIVKPLLHTWSLSVEFQFYLVWPAIMVALFRWKGRPAILAGTVIAAVLSLAASIYMTRKNLSGAFYLTPFRIHEFAIGSLIVFLEGHQLIGRKREAIYLCGLAAVLFSMFAFSEGTVFPDYAALVPTLGAALMIYAGPHARASWILRTRPMLFLGTISYSLYLIHWPLVVFAHYLLKRDLSVLETTALFAATFALSLLLHRYVEVVFRRPRTEGKTSPIRFNLACVSVIALVAAPATHSWLNGGWAWRLPPGIQGTQITDLAALQKYVWSRHPKLKTNGFTTNKNHVLIIGDSQAADLINMLAESGQDKSAEIASSVVFYECGTLFIEKEDEDKYWNADNVLTAKDPKLKEICKTQISDALSSSYLGEADSVVLSMIWSPENIKYLDRSIEEFRKRTTADIYVVGRKDMTESGPTIVNKHGKLEGLESFASRFKAPEALRVNEILKKRYGDYYVDLMDLVCPQTGYCHVLTKDEVPLFFDRAHLTRDGATFIGTRLIEQNPGFLMNRRSRASSIE